MVPENNKEEKWTIFQKKMNWIEKKRKHPNYKQMVKLVSFLWSMFIVFLIKRSSLMLAKHWCLLTDTAV